MSIELNINRVATAVAGDAKLSEDQGATQGAKLAFFELGNIQLELIEPYGGPSVWQDFLDETGGGIHHIAYHVDDMETAIEKCKAFGMELVQYGKYGDASGAYAYFDASAQLGCCIELLCDFGKKE